MVIRVGIKAFSSEGPVDMLKRYEISAQWDGRANVVDFIS